MRELESAPVYKAHRIHTSRLMRGPWVSIVVSIGTRQPMTKDSLTDTVTRVPGEYPSEAEAMQAAMRYLDEQEAHLREQREQQAAPTSAATDRALAHDSRSQGEPDQHARQLRLC